MRFLLILAGAVSLAAAPAPLLLENRHMSLQFEAASGVWTGWTDRATGDPLVSGRSEHSGAAPQPAARLDLPRLDRAVAGGQAARLEGQWLYTPQPPPPEAVDAFLAARWDGAAWAPTPVPSRRGTGDDRLHDRTGQFWYRREFVPPAGLAGEELALAIGAVDDFDTAYLNGVWIGDTGMETPHFWEAPRFYRFAASLLRPGQTNILLLRVTNGGFDGGIAGPVVLGAASLLAPDQTAEHPPVEPLLEQLPDATRLTLTARRGGLEYRMTYELPGAEAAFSRQLSVRNTGPKEVLYETAVFATPPLAAGPRQSILFPGALPAGDQPVAALKDGQSLNSRSQDPLVVLWDPSRKRGLGAWFYSEDEFSPVAARRRGAGVELRHTQAVVARLAPGQTVQLGRQYFWLASGTRDNALHGIQRVYERAGLRAPAGRLDGLEHKVIYCGHPGGTPEQQFRGYGGFKALEAYTPVLQQMGVDLLWLLPVWEHGDGRRWNLYGPFDHFQVSPLYGTTNDLKSLSAALAARSMGLLFDLVPHGPPDFTPLAKAHPEWTALDPAGKPRYEWGQLAFDNALPGWQDYMGRAAEWGAREFGAVGARVDCAAGGPANFNPAAGSRPSRSTLAAGLGMSRAIRDGYLRARPGTVLIPEEYTGATVYHPVSDLTYDAQLYYLMADLAQRNASPADWAASFQTFLHDQQETLPPGALKMRWISNHDTVSWTFQKRRPLALYGVERLRALWALCALIPGVPMIYQGDENPAVYGASGPSSVEWLGRLNRLRKETPALAGGAADYQAVAGGAGVFTCLRASGASRALVLISFSPAASSGRLTASPALSGAWTDRLSGEPFTATADWALPMAPFQVRILTPGQ